jgi:5-methylcytosine-specific restriction endonuclease McrA
MGKTKKCAGCHKVKPLSEFHNNRASSDGKKAQCKDCRSQAAKIYRVKNKGKMAKRRSKYYDENREKESEQRKKYYNGNREKVLKRQKAYRAKNKDKISKRNKKYRERNKEKIAQKRKIYRSKNKEKIAQTQKIYEEKNKEKISKRVREFRIKNKDKVSKRNKNWKLKNKDKIRAQERRRRALEIKLEENFTAEEEKMVMDTFEHKCFNCGSAERLCVDHYYPLIDGNLLTTSNAIILCRSCNSSKGAKYPEEFFTIDKWTRAEELMKQATELYLEQKNGFTHQDK